MNGKAIVCAAMRKLLHIAFGVLKSNRPFDPTDQPCMSGAKTVSTSWRTRQ